MSILPKKRLWGENIPCLVELREKGAKAFTDYGWPTAKTEAWKYSSFNESDLKKPIFDTTHPPCNCHQQYNQLQDLPFNATKITYCNGKMHHGGFSAPKGVVIKPLMELIYNNEIRFYLNKSFDMQKFPFAALNTAYLERGLLIIIKRCATLKKPLYITYCNHGKRNILSSIHNIIVCEGSSSATLIEHYTGENKARYLQNVVNEIYVHQNAKLHHITLQNESSRSHHIVLNSVEIKQNGQYISLCAQKGARLSRQESYIKLLQSGARAQADCVYRLLENKQVCDTTTNILHLAPQTYSNQLVKGVAQKAGVGVFQGQIHIAKGAVQSEGYQLHRALMLDNKAEIDCKPELEIFADDVKCSHGATSGYVDQEQLFYLTSRGINENEAFQILVDAYIDEVVNKIDDPKIQKWVKQNF